LQRLVDQYPLFSRADEALWDLGDSYGKMGNRFRPKAGEAYSRIVRDYPMSSYVEDAKKRLKEMEMPVPQADPAAYARMKYEAEHREKAGMIGRSTGFLKRGPDVHMAAKSGNPAMTTLSPTVPASVPMPAGAGGGVTDVTASTITGTSALDTQKDARANPQATGAPVSTTGTATGTTPATATGAASTGAPASTPAATSNEPLPTNANYQQKPKKQKKNNKKQTTAPATNTQAAPATQTSQPPPKE